MEVNIVAYRRSRPLEISQSERQDNLSQDLSYERIAALITPLVYATLFGLGYSGRDNFQPPKTAASVSQVDTTLICRSFPTGEVEHDSMESRAFGEGIKT
jgi:hypothetical protein